MPFLRFALPLVLLTLLIPQSATAQQNKAGDAATVTLNRKADGYRGIWYMNQPSGDEYVYKYSGGLGTYCAKHNPFAVYCPEVDKTFFCYGGAKPDNDRRLLHMVSYFDHKTKNVPAADDPARQEDQRRTRQPGDLGRRRRVHLDLFDIARHQPAVLHSPQPPAV